MSYGDADCREYSVDVHVDRLTVVAPDTGACTAAGCDHLLGFVSGKVM